MDSASGFTILPAASVAVSSPGPGDGLGLARPALWSIELDASEAAIAPRPWIAPGYLMRGAITALFGAGSAGKSSLAVAWSIALALGVPCHRMRSTAPCRVLIFNVEDDANEQRRRFAASLRTFGATTDDVRDRITIAGPNGVGTLLQPHPLTGRPTAEAALRDLEALIEARRPDVLILDPLAELHTIEENDNTGVRAVMAAFRTLAQRHDLALVLVHHTRKGSASAAGDPESGRGASAIASAARIVLTAVSMTEQEEQGFGLPAGQRNFLFRLDGAKSNYATLTAAEWFERQGYTLDNGDHVGAAIPWTPVTDVVTLDQREAIANDVAIGSPAGPWSTRLSDDARSIRHLLVRHGVVTRPGQKDALTALRAQGFQEADFRLASNRMVAKGLRSSDGRPSSAAWLDSAAIA